MTDQPPKPPFLILRIVLAAILLVLLFGLGHKWDNTRPVAPASVTVKAPPFLHTPGMPYEESRAPEAPPPTPPPLPQAEAPKPPADGIKRIAVIIDDVGISRAQTEPLFHLPAKVTMAFLPYGRASTKMSDRAAQEGYEVMLHLPMQPTGKEDPGPNALLVGLPSTDVAQRLNDALAAVPSAVGVNNHMGSAATANAELMQNFMQALAPSGKFFVDSYTAGGSVAFPTARALGIKAIRRDVFLDNDPSPEAIWKQLRRAEGVARRHGHAVVIGHPYPSTVSVLNEWLATLEKQGLKLVKVSELLQ